MALFEKKVQWQGDEEGYSIFKGKEDITPSCLSAWYNDDLLVYSTEEEQSWILRNYSNCLDGEHRPAEKLGGDGLRYYIREAEGSFYCYCAGEGINDQIEYGEVEGDLWIFHRDREETWRIPDVARVNPGQFVSPELVSSRFFDVIFLKTGKDKFRLISHGEECTEDTTASISGDDIILYCTMTVSQYVIQGGTKMRSGTWKLNDLETGEENILFKKLQDSKYHLYYKGTDLSTSAVAFKQGSSIVLYLPESNSYYWVEEGWDISPGSWREGSCIARNSSVLWHGNGKMFQIYLKGRRVTDEVQIQQVGSSGMVMHEPTMTIIKIPDFFSLTDNVLRGVPEE